MKKEHRMSKGIVCNWWKILLFLLLISFVSVGCGDDDGNGSPTTPTVTGVIPTPGAWAGQGISFTVNPDAASISNVSVTYDGRASGTRCSFSYETTVNLSTSSAITNGTFTLSTSNETITGTFTDPNTATVQVSWSRYNSVCDATASGSRTYTATPQ